MSIQSYINKLNTREKIIVSSGIILTFIILIYAFVLTPLMERYTDLERIIRKKESQYQEMVQLREEYLTLKKELQELEKVASRRKENFSPLTFMESVSSRATIKNRVVSMKPIVIPIGENYRESSVEVKIERIVLEQILKYLRLIEDSQYPLRIKTLHLKSRYDDPGFMDATVTVSFYEKLK